MLAGGQDLGTDALGQSAGGVLLGQEETGLDLLLGDLDLGGSDGGGETDPLLLEEMDKVVDLVAVLGDGVDTKETGVLVGLVERDERVGEAVLVDHGRETRGQVAGAEEGLVVGANDGLHDQEVVVLGGQVAGALDGEGNASVRGEIVTDADLRAGEAGLVSLGGGGVGLEAAKGLLGLLDESIVVDVTGADKDQAVGGVVFLLEFGQVLGGQARDGLGVALDGATEGLALEGGGVKVVEHDLIGLRRGLLLLLQHTRAGLLHRRLGHRALDEVAEDLNRGSSVAAEHLCRKERLLARRTGLGDATQVLESARLALINHAVHNL